MNLNYRVYGQGQPFLILHGLFGMSDNWLNVAKALSDRFEVYIIDLRNHGLSEHSDEWDYTSMAADIANFITDHQLMDCIVMGHSMGGKVVMHLAARQQHLLEKIILVDIAPRYYPVHHQTIIDALNSLQLDKIGSRQEADNELATKIEVWTIRQFLLKNLARNKEGFAWKMNLKVISDKIENVGEEMPKGFTVDIPTLFIRGAKSDYISDADREDINQRFTDATLLTVEDAGHWVHAEKPEELVEAVLNFVED